MGIRKIVKKEDVGIAGGFDPDFKYKIMERKGGESLFFCFACGTCINSCPTREIDERFNPRKVIKMALLGMKERVFQNKFVWMCSAHYSCQERCPQGVHIGAIASAVREMAEREGYRFEDCLKASDKGDVITSEELDFEFKYKVAEEKGGENIVRCFACGSCTASCPESKRDSRYNPRRFIRKIILGAKKEAFLDPFMWLCSTHYRCMERCPQGVNIKEIMSVIKDIAIEEGYREPK